MSESNTKLPVVGRRTPPAGSTVEVCHVCQSEFSDATTPGEFCYRCRVCDHLTCAACSENEEGGPWIICDECHESDPSNDNNPATGTNDQV